MKRREFFAQIKQDLLETLREISQPLMEDKLEKMDRAVDSLLDVQWLPLSGHAPEGFRGWQEIYLGGHWVYLYSDGSRMRAFDKICSSCQSITTRLDGQKIIKCLMCEHTFSLVELTGELDVTELPIKAINRQYYVGISQLLRK